MAFIFILMEKDELSYDYVDLQVWSWSKLNILQGISVLKYVTSQWETYDYPAAF